MLNLKHVLICFCLILSNMAWAAAADRGMPRVQRQCARRLQQAHALDGTYEQNQGGGAYMDSDSHRSVYYDDVDGNRSEGRFLEP